MFDLTLTSLCVTDIEIEIEIEIEMINLFLMKLNNKSLRNIPLIKGHPELSKIEIITLFQKYKLLKEK
jgi:hypothetical protein